MIRFTVMFEITLHWWLVELPMWLTDGFLLTFGKVEGTVRIHVNSRVAPVQDGGGEAFQTSENSESLENFKFW